MTPLSPVSSASGRPTGSPQRTHDLKLGYVFFVNDTLIDPALNLVTTNLSQEIWRCLFHVAFMHSPGKHLPSIARQLCVSSG